PSTWTSAVPGGPKPADGPEPGSAAPPQAHRPSSAAQRLRAARASPTRNSPDMQLKRGRWRRERSDQRREAGLAPCPLPSFLAASARAGGSSSSSPSTSPTATRGSPTRALKQFFGWTEAQRVGLDDIEPVTGAAYV